MPTLQDQYDDAMFDFTRGDCDAAIAKLKTVLSADPNYFDAQLSLGGAYYAKADYTQAIEEGKKAESLRPHDQLVHTNLSRAYMKIGDKKTAEHHQLQSRIASWKEDMTPPGAGQPAQSDSELQIERPKPPPMKMPEKFPEMPWKKKPAQAADGSKPGV